MRDPTQIFPELKRCFIPIALESSIPIDAKNNIAELYDFDDKHVDLRLGYVILGNCNLTIKMKSTNLY